jgi:hypothetical protein
MVNLLISSPAKAWNTGSSSGTVSEDSTGITTLSGVLIVAGNNSRITSSKSEDYLDMSTDDAFKFVGVSGSDNTDLQVSVDGAYPIINSNTDTSVAFSDAVQLGIDGTDGQLVFYNELGVSDYTVTVNPSSSQGSNVTYTLPPTDGAATEFLQTDGSGVLTWVPVSGVSPSSGDVTAVGDCTGSACFASGGSGNTLVLNSDYLEFDGSEDVKLSTATSNKAIWSTDTGVTQMDIPFTIGLQNGETIGNTTNNVYTFTGDSEDFTLTFSSDKVTASSSTGVNNYVFGATTLAGGSNNPNLTVSGTFTGTGISSTKTLSSGADGAVLAGGFYAVKSLAGSSNTLAGLTGSATFSNTAVTSQDVAYGVFGTGTKSGASSTLSNFYGVYGQKATVSSGTLTNNYGLGVEGAAYLTPQASAPSNARSGDLYVDSTASPDELCFYDGAGWQGISSGTDANCA